MLNPIRLNSNCRLQSLLNRRQCAKLWEFARSQTSSGIVTLLIPEILTLFNISCATLYRWLKEGRELGYFRYYKKIGKFELKIVLGGKKAVCKNLGLTDWGAVVEKPLHTVLTKKEDQLRQQTTLHHTQWLEMKSIKAAQASVGKKHFKPYKAKFGSGKPVIGKPVPKTPRRATTTATRPNMQRTSCNDRQALKNNRQETPPIKIKKTAFSRKHTPIGSSQETIAKQLGISVRSVTRHLAKTESVQVMYKLNTPEEIRHAEAEIFFAIEEGKTPPYFVREGEIYRFGNSLYNLNEDLKSEWFQRIKYKFYLYREICEARNVIKNSNLCFNEFRNLFNDFDLDSLDDYVLLVMFHCNLMRSFKEFFSEFRKQLRILKKWNSGKLTTKRRHPPLLAGR